MLQRLNPLQDENSQPYGLKGRQDIDRRAVGLGKTPAGKTPFGKQLGQSSTRKALGNITNRPSGLQQETFPKSASKTGPAPRKTLGDITNTTPAKPALSAKPLVQKAVLQKLSASKTSQAKPQCQAELYAQDGIEMLAGKGKQQLDCEREARDLAEIRNKAAYIASLPALRPPVKRWSKVSHLLRVAVKLRLNNSSHMSQLTKGLHTRPCRTLIVLKWKC